MAEVHEITRTAFNQIVNKIYDFRDYEDIEWVAVDCWTEFGVCPDWAFLHINRGFKTIEEAQEHAEYWDGYISGNCWIEGVWYPAHVNESEVWHIVDDEPEPDRYGLYQRYALEAYLGDFAEEYDIDAIEDAVTVLDYSTGSRYWTMDDDELAEYIADL